MIINIDAVFSPTFSLKVENLKINKHDIIGIMGSNGSGKSSFVKCLWSNFNKDKNIDINKTFNYDILQQVSNFGPIKLFNLVLMIRNLSKKQLNIIKLFEEYDLLDFKNIYYSKLSPGQQQRFKFMLLELFNNEILILDEPFNFLDSSWKNKILNRIKIFTVKYENIFIIDHDLDLIKKICNRIICFKNGRIIMDTKNLCSINQEDIDKIV